MILLEIERSMFERKIKLFIDGKYDLRENSMVTQLNIKKHQGNILLEITPYNMLRRLVANDFLR